MKIDEYHRAFEEMSGFSNADPEALEKRNDVIVEVKRHLRLAAAKATSINTSLEWVAGEVLKERDKNEED